MASEYVPCRYLDHSVERYGASCTLVVLDDGVKYWKRNSSPDPNAVMEVQFCGLGRGRINSILACYSLDGEVRMPCHEAAKKEGGNGE